MLKIVTAVVNNPIFIEIQYHTLKKYMRCEYEFIVFNDAKSFPDFTNGGDVTIKAQIQNKCEELHITCINIPNEHHKINKCACLRCTDAMNYVLEYQKINPCKYLLLDSDMFLIDYFDIKEYEDYKGAIVIQNRKNDTITYCWNGLYFFDFTNIKNQELLNWGCDDVEGCDVGGQMRFWLRTQENDLPLADQIRRSEYNCFNKNSFYYIKHLWSCSWDESEYPQNINIPGLLAFLKCDPRNVKGKFYCEMYDKKFLHYRAGGNWNSEGMNFHHQLTLRLKSVLLD